MLPFLQNDGGVNSYVQAVCVVIVIYYSTYKLNPIIVGVIGDDLPMDYTAVGYITNLADLKAACIKDRY